MEHDADGSDRFELADGRLALGDTDGAMRQRFPGIGADELIFRPKTIPFAVYDLGAACRGAARPIAAIGVIEAELEDDRGGRFLRRRLFSPIEIRKRRP